MCSRRHSGRRPSWRSGRCLGWRAFALLAGCAWAHADPFTPASPDPVPAGGVSPQPPGYRVAGAAVLGRDAVAAIQLPQGRFVVVRPGEKIGASTVVEITLDAVRLETESGFLRLPVTD